MGAFSDDMAATALELLTEFGQSISVTRDVVGDYSDLTGTVSDSSDTTYSGYGYPENYSAFNIDNVLIQQNDIKLTFSSTTEPLVSDIFTVGSLAYTAINVEKITAQGENIIYIVRLRQ